MSKRVRKKQGTTVLQKLESSLSYILQGNLKKAEAVLSEAKTTEDEYVMGYKDALQGLLDSLNSKDTKSFVFRLKKDPQFLRNELERLKESEASHLCTEWDLGYFKCWTSYLQGLLQIPASAKE